MFSCIVICGPVDKLHAMSVIASGQTAVLRVNFAHFVFFWGGWLSFRQQNKITVVKHIITVNIERIDKITNNMHEKIC